MALEKARDALDMGPQDTTPESEETLTIKTDGNVSLAQPNPTSELHVEPETPDKCEHDWGHKVLEDGSFECLECEVILWRPGAHNEQR